MIDLNYTRSGNPDKPRVFFLHGFLGDRRDWKDVTEGLADVFDCIAVDLPGHGQTRVNGSEDGYGMPATSTAIIELADKLGADSFSMVGYSLGGRLALYLSSIYAMRVDRLVLESASPGLRKESERQQRLEHDDALACHLLAQAIEPFVDAWYAQPMFAALRGYGDRFAAMRARRIEQDPVLLSKNLTFMGTGAQPSLWKELPNHHIPTLCIVGEHDPKFRGIAKEMAAVCPAMRVEVISDSGHNVHFEKPADYTARVREFLTASN